jgi:GNAT superfamily N-acetyltransferase
MIRLAQIADKTRAIVMLKNFFADQEPEWRNRTKVSADRLFFVCDPAYMERLFLIHMQPHNLCLIYDVDGPQGILMAAAEWHLFGSVRMARETLWWIEPDYRGNGAFKMVDAYEDWARREGCALSGLTETGNEGLGRLYRRKGYCVAETNYLKVL